MRRRVALVAAVLTVAGGCGVPTEDEAHLTDADEVPFGLLEAEREDGAVSPGGTTFAQVYLYAEEEGTLVPVVRRVEDRTLATVLDEVERGPTEGESAAGLRSALTDSRVIIGTDITGTTATVDLAESFSTISGSEQLVAIAQLVYTATAQGNMSQVVFTLEGRPVTIPHGDGSLTGGPVTRDDFRELGPGT
jgi:spore germination protein GerM